MRKYVVQYYRAYVPAPIRKTIGKFRTVAGIIVRSHKRDRIAELRWPLALALSKARQKAVKPGHKPLAIGAGFEYHKRHSLRMLFPDKNWIFLPTGERASGLGDLIDGAPPHESWAWSYRNVLEDGTDLFHQSGVITRVEDGFIRGKGLGNALNPGFSFCIDQTGIYFDGTKPSDLETLCRTYKFSQEDLTLARSSIDFLKEKRLSKYNLDQAKTNDPVLGEGSKHVVLVLGQVEDDQSILCNDSKIRTNKALLKCAITENPDAHIVFKPHPDVESGQRPARSDVNEVAEPFVRVGMEYALPDLLEKADTVYTISSLGGFEALMRSCRVHTFGRPFYAGWGLTHDALAFPRRDRTLTLDQLFAASYLIYPVYFDPANGERLTLQIVAKSLV